MGKTKGTTVLVQWFYALRYISFIVVVSSFLGAVLTFYIGAIKTYKALTILSSTVKSQDTNGVLSPADLAIVYPDFDSGKYI